MLERYYYCKEIRIKRKNSLIIPSPPSKDDHNKAPQQGPKTEKGSKRSPLYQTKNLFITFC